MKVATQFEIENRRKKPSTCSRSSIFLPRSKPDPVQHLTLDYSTVVEHEGNPCITP